MLRRLDRYVLAEILGPLALGFLIYTFIMLLRLLFRMADLIIRSEVPPEIVGRLLLLSLPNIVVLTIPMSFLFAILIAVGRLSSDSELIAIRSSGISLFTLYRPILVLSAILTAGNVYLMLDVLPEGNQVVQDIRIELLTHSISEEVQPRTPYTGYQERMLYVFESPPGERRWKGTFLSKANPGSQSEVYIGEWGEARGSDDGTQVLLDLYNVFTHQVDPKAPETYNTVFHNELRLTLPAQSPRQAANSVKRGLRELPFRDLRRVIEDPETDPVERNLAKIELHKKFSIPAACLVFGLLGLPLGFSNARGGRSSGFAISLGVILLYYILLSLGEDFASRERAPAWAAVWFSNVFLLLLGAFLLTRRNRDKSVLLSRFDQWIQEHLWRRVLARRERREARRAARRRASEERRSNRRGLVLRLPDLRIPFPNSMDRYVLMTFLRVLTIATFAGLSLYIVADLTENVESILKHDIGRDVVLDYYKFKSIDIFYQISPVIVLVTTLVAFGVLSRSNEITALKALGVSLYRVSVPVVLAGAAVSGVCMLLQTEVLAASNERVNELRDEIRGRSPAGFPRGPRADHRWLYSNAGGYLFNYTHFDEARQEIQGLQVFKFDDSYRLTDRLVVAKAVYLGDGWWTLHDGWARSFRYPTAAEDDGSIRESLRIIDVPVKELLPEGPEFFGGDLRQPTEMAFAELRQYIEDLRAFGWQDTAPLEVELHNKIAYPALSLVMAFVALPFAFRLGRQGALYGVGISIVVGIVLLLFIAFFTALGKGAMLPPVVAVWSPGMIFTIFSLYLFLGVRT